MKIKILLLIILTSFCVNLCAKEIATFNTNAEKYKTFNELKLNDFKIGRVNDKSQEVYFTEDKFGVGITKGGEFTLNLNSKRLVLAGLSGIICYDKENPTKLYRFDTKKINKEGFSCECQELGLTLNTKVTTKTGTSIDLNTEITSNSDKKIVIAFCFPMDGTTTLQKDVMVWIKDFANAYNTFDEEVDTYANLAPNDQSISRYPMGAMLTGYMSIAMATSPLSRDSKFVFYKSLKSFANQYELNLKKDQTIDLDFSIYRIPYEWGFRGAYAKYTEIFKDYFPEKDKITPTNIKELDDTNYYFKSLITFDGYKIKGPISLEDLAFLKCVAKNKPVYYEVSEEDFDKEYSKAVYAGFIPITDNINKPIVEKLKNCYSIIQDSTWEVCPQSESKNQNVTTERYKNKDKTYIVAYNPTDIKRVTVILIYEYNGTTKITNIRDDSEYNIKNKSIDIVLDPNDLAMFSY